MYLLFSEEIIAGGEDADCWLPHHSPPVLGLQVITPLHRPPILSLQAAFLLPQLCSIHDLLSIILHQLPLPMIFLIWITSSNMFSGFLLLSISSKVSSEKSLRKSLHNDLIIKVSSFRSQGIRFQSLMEERKVVLETGCQNKSHRLGIGTVNKFQW